MKLPLVILVLLPIISRSLAAPGDRCRSGGRRGTCKKVSSCTSGFTVTGECRDDGEDIKCCIAQGCTKHQEPPLISLAGKCYDKNQNTCSGGEYHSGLCPGDNDVQCCIKSPISTPPADPAKPSCPAAKKISQFGPDDAIFSREATQRAHSFWEKAETGLTLCAAIGIMAPLVVGLPCGFGLASAHFLAKHADECTKKGMCLKLENYITPVPQPYCIGGNDGCCSET